LQLTHHILFINVYFRVVQGLLVY